ncbi:hypothetical protein [Streptomyces sp. URMC 125]|uniref:hypothetical protein n=1 Tax=Streptomyces sp. URMC 125 TaxID=3423419 RepID=UPI003F19408F
MPEERNELPDLLRLRRALRDPDPDCAREAAEQVGGALMTWLLQLGQWDELDPAHRAAVYWALVDSSEAAEGNYESGSSIREGFESLIDFVHHLAEERRYPPMRQGEVKIAKETFGRLAALPEGWRAEVLRRVLREGEELMGAISTAQMRLNMLRSRFGIDDRRAEAVPAEGPKGP